MKTNDQILSLGDSHLFVRRLGEFQPAAITLLFLHEGLGSVRLWQKFPAQLCKATGCHGVLYDRHGYGQSSPLTEKRDAKYLEHEGEKVLPALIKALGIERCILFGHSDGGSIALYAAGLRLPNILGAIIEAPHVHLDELSISGIEQAKAAFENGKLRRALTPYHGAKTESMFYGWAGTWLSPEFRRWNFHDKLENIQCPLLLIQGEKDQYGKRGQLDAIEKHAKGMVDTLYINGCGHTPHVEENEKIVQRSTEFIRQIAAP
jgi:pimeloyl-ACP methyl ester carboxylesterase